jgi:serine/threonine protein kinase
MGASATVPYDSRVTRSTYALEPTPLDRGGQAEVFRATDRRDMREVAFKRRRFGDAKSAERFRREITTHQAISSPHVMPILDVADDASWYVMPLACGRFIDLHLAADRDICRALIDAACGLSTAHDQGFVHRDIKPDNILELHTPRRWVVTDFGLGRHDLEYSLRLTSTDQFLGSAMFAAPEMWSDAHGAGPAADVYSLGKVIAWATSHKRPKPAETGSSDRPLWQSLVTQTTRLDATDRPSLPSVIDALDSIYKTCAGTLRSQWSDFNNGDIPCYRCRQPVSYNDRVCPNCHAACVDY